MTLVYLPERWGVHSRQPHSFGNKLLFWPRRLLWARAVAVLTCKPWEGGAALAARGWGHRRSARDEQETARAASSPGAWPLLSTPHPRGDGANAPHLCQLPLQIPAEFSRTEAGRGAEAGSS